MVFGSMFDFLITKGYTSKFTQQSLDWLPESTTDSTLSMTVVGSSSQKVTNITVKAIGAAASFAVTTTTYTSKTVALVTGKNILQFCNLHEELINYKMILIQSILHEEIV